MFMDDYLKQGGGSSIAKRRRSILLGGSCGLFSLKFQISKIALFSR